MLRLGRVCEKSAHALPTGGWREDPADEEKRRPRKSRGGRGREEAAEEEKRRRLIFRRAALALRLAVGYGLNDKNSKRQMLKPYGDTIPCLIAYRVKPAMS